MRKPGSLLVFSDDWGRHPSSCQHLVGEMLGEFPVVWVNTIGMRTPKLDWVTMRRAAEKLAGWVGRKPDSAGSGVLAAERAPLAQPADSPMVVSPRMWPWFTRAHDRRFNRHLLASQLRALIAALPPPVVAITTIPITADLPGVLDVAKWVYYCVDDFSQWPGLDGATMAQMDDSMIAAANELVAVSEQLRSHIHARGRDSSLLTHGVHLSHWLNADAAATASSTLAGISGPIALFWGVIDGRMDVEWLARLATCEPKLSIVLAGPMQNPDPTLLGINGLHLLGPVPFAELPTLAARADVLVMPYIDAPVTRAMQPLKLKEYLATGRPVVVRDLPATHEWADCMDVANDAEQFVAAVGARLDGKLTDAQVDARRRLADESWSAKARQFAQALMLEG